MEVLRIKTAGRVITDMFAGNEKDTISQARALYDILMGEIK